MYRRKPGNPKIEELNKSYKDRSYNLTALSVIKREAPNDKGINIVSRYCAWCADGKLNHGNQKYCSTDCSNSAMSWAYPQKEEGLFSLMLAQDWKCKLCQYDWKPQAETIHQQLYARYSNAPDAWKLGERYDWGLIKRLKNRVETKRRPEVDHVVPIFKGGQSLGLDNHQAICYTCHRSKTGQDLSGKRKA